MRSDRDGNQAGRGLKIAAAAGLAFLHLPILLIFLYAFTTEDKSYVFPPPGFTTQWFAIAWERQDVRDALWLSVKVASIATVIALVLGTMLAAGHPAHRLARDHHRHFAAFGLRLDGHSVFDLDHHSRPRDVLHCRRLQ
jgi:ABC-type spermidine/putrescine transport system permease subunit II